MRAGRVAAKSMAMAAASSWAMSAALRDPAASRTAATSSICSSSVTSRPSGSDIPVPRRSNMMRRLKAARPSSIAATRGWSHMCSIWLTQLGT